MPAYDASSDPRAWRSSDVHQQQYLAPPKPAGWQGLHQHWLDQLQELRLFVAAQARETLFNQAHQYCTGLADWTGRSLLERIEYLHLPPPLMELMTSAAQQQSHQFCGALASQLHDQAGAVFAGVQQLWSGDTPPLAAATQPPSPGLATPGTDSLADAPANSAPLWPAHGPMQDMPAEPGPEVLLIGDWNDGGAPLLA